MERAIKVAGGIPIHERNREVVLIPHTLLLEIADHHNLLQDDPKVIRDQLKQLAKEVDQILAADTTLKDFLQMPIEKITPAVLRAALNDAGATVAEHSLKTMPKLIRLWLPCIA